MRKNLIYFIIFLTLVSCATTQQYISNSKQSPLIENHARIKFYRPSNIYGSACSVKITENNQIIGKIGPGGEIIYDTFAGNVRILGLETLNYKSFVPLDLTVEEGKCYTINVKIPGYYFEVVKIEDVEIQSDTQTNLERKKNKAYLGVFLNNNVYGNGVKISNLLPNSPAENAGLKKGYSIYQINGETCNNVESLTKLLNKYKDGDKISVLYYDNSDNIKKTIVTLTSKSKYDESLIVKDENIKKGAHENNPSKIILALPDIYRTTDFTILLQGQVTDDEGLYQVYVNNEIASLKMNGEFQKRVRLIIGKNQIKIKAIDVNDNETIREILIIRDEMIDEEEFSDVDFAFKTSNHTQNAIAVVFGIEEYLYAPNVANAYNDAEIFREYLISTFGLERENIYFRYNEKATKGEFEKVFSKNGWISKTAKKDSEIYVFYAGHGVASTDNESAYLIPNDIDPNYASTGYSLNELYNNLSKIESKSTTIILDACFSGISRENEMLLADSRPVSIEVKQGSIPGNLNVFSASSGNEISSGYSQKLHGLFTYFFLKGLNKNADINNDRNITYGEMDEYLKENVSSQARKMGREQNPQLHTNDRNKVLLKY